MLKTLFEKVFNSVGERIAMPVVFLILGALAMLWVDRNVVTYEALAAESKKIHIELSQNEIVNDLSVLHLRRQIAQERLEEAEDVLEVNPDSAKWRSRLATRSKELSEINAAIKGSNERLSNLRSKGGRR
jgi:hypothetical protein